MVTAALVDWLVVGPIALVLLAYHRRFPLPVAVAVTALTAGSAMAAGAGLICLVSIAARRRTLEIVGIGGLAVVTGVAFEHLYPSTSDWSLWFEIVFVSLVVAISIALGMYIGARRELIHSLRLRAEAAEREQSLRIAQAQSGERTRIAREMHDVLAHRISLLSMHAGALAFREDLPPDQVRAEARLIQQTANEALGELRGVLGLLRSPSGGPDAPQPSLSDLESLIEEARGAGEVELRSELTGPAPAPWLGRHMYRVVQECLTNARKHAPGAPVVVTLGGRAGGQATIEVRNGVPRQRTPAVTGAGLGLIGLAERAAATGGTLTHGVTPEGGYAVQVQLPWPAGGPQERA